ncbi:MAG: AdoMet-dependent rRNA methyltransferase spb1 [Chrysothrix sp. TS-e1954]|nr:MAG: AdoMet-dependent rRNA methyltransferase spb1 [Chrysothrix sp. TS-e1954]
MGVQKKHGKGRLDRWYRLAKEKGYRARAAFKLIQLNKKYHVLEKSKVLLDLCAAPGSWCQVAAEAMPTNSIIVGVDLSPIKPIPRCITFQSDITTDKCRATIRQHLKTWKADTVLHDGAPNVGTAWVQDAFSQAELVLQALRLATDFLVPGGTFITKVFRSKDYNSLLWVFNQLFGKVEATKPPSSRNVSAEIFVVCRGFKAPKRIDPRFLDPKSVFAELSEPTPNNEAKVFNPEKKKRKREGYEEGDWTQFKEQPASAFIQTTDPIAMLGSLNKLSFEQKDNGDIALATLERLPETTQEVRTCCADLKVLGRKEFKVLLKWRLKVRDKFGFSAKKKREAQEADVSEEVAEVESMDEEMRIQEEMQQLKDQSDTRKKKEKRKDNERKRKEIVRMQMNMTTPQEIGLEQTGPWGEDSMFNLKTVDKTGRLGKIADGRMHTVTQRPEPEEESEEEVDTDEEGDDLEGELDTLYDQYQERRMQADAKYRAKKARKEHNDDDFEGFSDRARSGSESSDDEDVVQDEASDTSSDEEGDEESTSLFHSAGETAETQGGLSRRAQLFFDQDIFKSLPGLDTTHDDSGIDMDNDSADSTKGPDANVPVHKGTAKPVASSTTKSAKHSNLKPQAVAQEIAPETGNDSDSDPGFEIVKNAPQQEDWTEGPVSSSTSQSRPNIDIITAEAMTLAHTLATSPHTRHTLTDDAFNRYSHRDTDGLPAWFLDDETRHSKLQRPVTAEAAKAIKEKLKALNARPIKKVREAKARKKMRAVQRLEKLKKKSALLADEDDTSERDKARNIEKLMAKAGKKKPKKEVKVVVAKGGNRGLSGRPRGTKGKYKMVDARLKKDTRALKRIAKKRK